MKNIFDFNNFEPVWENSVYDKSDVGYNGLLANPDLLENSFWINLLGFIGTKLFSPNSPGIKSYFGANKVRIDAIGHESGDLFILTKAAKDAKIIDEKTANEITRFFALLKNKPDVVLDEKLIRSLISKISLTKFTKLDANIKDIITKILAIKESASDPKSIKDFLKPLHDIATKNKWAPEWTRILSDEIAKASEDDKILLGFLDKNEVERKKKEEEERKKKEEEEKLKKSQAFLDNWDYSAGFSYFTTPPTAKEKINRRMALRKTILAKNSGDINSYLSKIKLNKKFLKAFMIVDIESARHGIGPDTIKNEYGIDLPEGIKEIPFDQFYVDDYIKNVETIFEGLPNKEKLVQFFKIKVFNTNFDNSKYSLYEEELWKQILDVNYDELAVSSTSSYGRRNAKKQNIWEGENYYSKTRGWSQFNSFSKEIRNKISKKLGEDLAKDPTKIKDLIAIFEKIFNETSGDKPVSNMMVSGLLVNTFERDFDPSKSSDATPTKPFLYEFPELMEYLVKNGFTDTIAKIYDSTFYNYRTTGEEKQVVAFKDQLFKLNLLGKTGFTKWMNQKDAERNYPIGDETIPYLVQIVKQGNFDNDNFAYSKQIVALNGIIPLLEKIPGGLDKFIEEYGKLKCPYFSSFVNNKKWFPEGIGNKIFWQVLDKELLEMTTDNSIIFYSYYGNKQDKENIREELTKAKGKEREIAKKYINSYLSKPEILDDTINNFDNSNSGSLEFMRKFGGQKGVDSFVSTILKGIVSSSRYSKESYKQKDAFNKIVNYCIDNDFKIDEKIWHDFEPTFISVISQNYYREEVLHSIFSLVPIYGKFIFTDSGIFDLIDSIEKNTRGHNPGKGYSNYDLIAMFMLENYNIPMGDQLKKKINSHLALDNPTLYKEKISNSYSELNTDHTGSSIFKYLKEDWFKNKRDEFRTSWQDIFDLKIKSTVYEEYRDICTHSLTKNIIEGKDKDTDEAERKRILKLVTDKFVDAQKTGHDKDLAAHIQYVFEPEIYKLADKEELRNIYNIGLRAFLKGISSAGDLDSDQPGSFLDGIETAIQKDAITQREADEILWSQQSMSVKMKFSKLIKESTLVGPVMNQIAGENTPIKPLIGTNDAKGKEILNKALRFNNFEIHKMEGVKKMGNENIFEYKKRLLKTYSSTAKEMIELKVKKIDETEEQREKKSGFYFQWMTPDGRHGGQGIKFLESFDVDMVPEGMDDWIKNNPDPKVIPAFHGTGSIGASMILRFGFKIVDASLKKTGRMLGDGVYFSNVLDKASQYIGDHGFTRSRGTVGYLLECEAYVGKDGVNYRSAGLGGDSIRSAEWCVFDPRVQLKIVRAHKVELVDREIMKKNFSKWYPKGISPGTKFETNESVSGINEEVMNEKKDPTPDKKYWCNFTFLDGDIPDGKGNKLRVDTWMKEFVDKKNPYIHVYPSQKGPNVNFNISDINMEGNFIIPNTHELIEKNENHMYEIFKDCLKASLNKK